MFRRIQVLLGVVTLGLIASGLTAFAIETELHWLTELLGAGPGARPEDLSGLLRWLVTVRDAVAATNSQYPFMAYGTDWLAFAHLVIAVVFVFSLRDPVRNAWVVDFGLLSCGGVLALALVAGQVRGIPMYWRLIDCSFGVVCAALLLVARRFLAQLRECGSGGTVSNVRVKPTGAQQSG